MRNSNHAIKFLLAQYRAIFKRAYIAGLAPAIMLTAALAAGSAQAANITTSDNNFANWTSGDAVTISGTVSGDFSNKIVNSLTIGAGASLSNAESGNSGALFTNKLTVDGGTLTIDNSNQNTIGGNGYGVLGWNDNENQANIGDGTSIFTVQGAAAKVNLTKTSIQFKQVNLLDGQITLGTSFGGDGSGSNWNTAIQAGYDSNSKGTGVMTIGSDGGTGPDITMKSGSLLSANNIEMNGGTITMSGGDQTYTGKNTALIYLSEGNNRVANFNDGEIKVIASGGIFGPELNFKGTDVTINEDGNLILGKITYFNQDSASKTSVITFNEGKLKNIGTITFDADNIALSEDNFAGLLADDGSKVNFSGSEVNLTVDGDADLLGLGVFGDSGALSANFNVSATELNLKAAGEVTLDSHFKTDKLTIDAKELTAKTATYHNVATKDYAFAIDQGTISVSDRVTLLEGSGLEAEDDPDHRIYVIASGTGTTATLNLVNDGSTQGQLINVDRVYVGLYANSYKASGDSTLNVDGNWNFGGARLVADTSGTATLAGTVSNVGELVINRTGKIEIASNANVTATRLLGSETGATGSIDINGMLTFQGDGRSETPNAKGEYANDISLTTTNININNGGTLAITGADTVEDIFSVTKDEAGKATGLKVETEGGKTSTFGGWDKDKVTLNAGGTLKIDLAAVSSELTAIGSENLATIKTDLVNEGYKGAFDFGGIKINLSPELQENIKNGSVSYDKLVSGGVNDVQNVDGMAGVTVEVSSSNASKGINLGNGAAAVELATGTNSVTVDGSLILKNNGTEDGYFVYTAPAQEGGKQSAADINVATDSGVNFTGSGRMGSITSTGTSTSATLTAGTGAQQTVEGEIDLETVTIGTGTVNVAEDVTATTLTLGGNLNNASESGTNTITAATLTQSAGTTLTTNKLVLGASGSGSDSALNGVVNATTITMNKATTDSNTLTIAGGVVTSETFEGASGAIINVGTDGSAQTAGAAGTLITNTMVLNGADLVIDPDWNSATGLSFASAKSFSDTNSTKYDAGVLTGNAYTLRNSILAVGVDKLGSDASYQNAKHEVTQLFAQYIDAKGNLSASGVGAILYVADNFKVDQDYKLVVDPTVTLGSESGDFDTIKSKYTGYDVYLDGNGVLAVDVDAANGEQAAITFAPSDNTVNIMADENSKIVITGDYRSSDTLKLFALEGGDGSADEITITGNVNNGSGILVETLNGLLSTVYTGQNINVADMDLNLDVARSAYTDTSSSVRHSIISYIAGDTNWESIGEADHVDSPTHGGLAAGVSTTDGKTFTDANGKPLAQGDYVAIPNPDYEDGTQTPEEDPYLVYHAPNNSFLNAIREQTETRGAAADAAAHMAEFGGAAQVALKAGSATTDAIAGRMGMGAQNTAITYANNGQGTGIWVTPIYMSADSDGFDAQGVDYGTDISLYGVALGGDYTLANGLRIGAMFNVGSGDADGQGAGSAVTSDFDYYGFGLYAGYSFGQLSIVGDVSYTAVDNDIEANTNIDKLETSLDSTNLSVGVTGSYAFESASGVKVTPHVGLRYSNIDVDDYTVTGRTHGTVGSYDADSLSVFSIPVGVTIATEFKSGTWSVKPSFDVTITGQFGDDEAEGTFKWAGVENIDSQLNSEIFDSFTYGASLGIAAQSESGISLGLAVGYTGSSNTDDLGVSANARFTF